MSTGLVRGDLRYRTGTLIGTFVAVLFAAVIFSFCAALLTSAVILNVESSDEGFAAPIAIFGTVGGVGVFVALFVVSSTTSLSVMQRRGDMALLRSIGATPRQVGRLVLVETSTVAFLAAVVGTSLGLAGANGLAPRLADIDDIPDSFEYRGHWLVPLVSVATIVLFGYMAALGVARGAGRTSAAEALVGAAGGQRTIGALRWSSGLFFLAGIVAMMAVSATVIDDPGLNLGFATWIISAGLVGLALLGPVVVRPVAALVSGVFRGSTMGAIGAANSLADAQRASATATPVALMVGLNVGLIQVTRAAAPLQVEGGEAHWSLWMMTGISALFAAIAIVNTTAMTITARTSQLSALRLAGATPGQVRQSTQFEAAIAALTGVVLGLVLALAASASFAVAHELSLVGMIHWPSIAALTVSSLLVSVTAASVAGGRAAANPDLLVAVE